MKLTINKKNYKNFLLVAEFLKKNKRNVNNIKIRLTKQKKELPSFSEIMPQIYKFLDYEQFFGIWLENFPFCILAENSRDHIVENSNVKIQILNIRLKNENFRKKLSGEKLNKCNKCKYNKLCSGFPMGYFEKYSRKELKPIPDLPVEVMIEVEPRCNFNCQFCFNKSSFARKGRNIKRLDVGYIKKIIDNISKSGIKIVRFTGGEPMLRKDIFQLFKYAKQKKLEVRLNTNGSLITKNIAKKMRGLVDNVLIPIHSENNKKEEEITGYPNALNKKIKAIKLLKKEKIPIVRIGTIATKENIKNFNKIAKLVLSLKIYSWEWYRLMSNKKSNISLEKKDVSLLVEKIINFRKKNKLSVQISNPFPFCTVDNPNEINSISTGAIFDEGHSRMVIDNRGFVKPDYFIDKNVGDPLNILEAWSSYFMKKMRNLKYLPKECEKCNYRFKCRGGSRHEAKIASGKYNAPDPLAMPKNIFE